MRDAADFDAFYRDTSARMIRYGYALTGDLGDGQDVVQEAYMRAWRHWRTVAAHPAPEAWLRLVIARLATDRWRRLRGWRVALARSGPPADVPPPGAAAVLLAGALRSLPEHLRQAIALYYLCDLSVQQIAEETGAATGTVTSWLHRGRAELAGLLVPVRPLEAHDAD